MVTIPEMKHNRFKQVDVPEASELYKRYGFGIGTRKESGEEFLDPSLSKVDMASEVAREVEKVAKEASAKEKEGKSE